MGWKGTLRSMRAAARRAERASRRRQKELERRQRERTKMVERERAEHEVALYENYLERVVSLHTESSEPIPWSEIARAPLPMEPPSVDSAEQKARERLLSYRAGFFDRLFRRAERRVQELQQAIEAARREDTERTRECHARFEAEFAEAVERRELAERLLAGDPEASRDALAAEEGFSEIADLGSNLTFHWPDEPGRPLEIELDVHGESVIPKESRSLLKNGTLSVKPLPKGVFYGLYQDYVCSAVLRVAAETFALLPVEAVVVTAVDQILDTRTGHLKTQPILSVAIPRATFETLQLDRLDPSDSMDNFLHRMSFRNTKGFVPVEKLDPDELAELLQSGAG